MTRKNIKKNPHTDYYKEDWPCIYQIWQVSGGYLKGVWKVSDGFQKYLKFFMEGIWLVCGRCLDGDFIVSQGCLEGDWRVSFLVPQSSKITVTCSNFEI